jgi:LPXTG-motif cell wall-anchored protein
MKKMILIISTLLGIFLFGETAYADSPLTSTDFNRAYADIEIVTHAAASGIIDEEIAAYLMEESNPIDVKAAIINALSWGPDNKDNAQLYSLAVYGITLEELRVEELSGDQQFCIGYLLAMDNYFDVVQAQEYLKQAKANMPESFTVAMIYGLTQSMNLLTGSWEDHIKPLLEDSSLVMDMRPEAVDIITEYMILYADTTPKTGESSNWPYYVVGALIMILGAAVVTKKRNKE